MFNGDKGLPRQSLQEKLLMWQQGIGLGKYSVQRVQRVMVTGLLRVRGIRNIQGLD